MRIIKCTHLFLFCFLAFIVSQHPALADQDATYSFQVRTENKPLAQQFWASFWDILAGKKLPQTADLTVKILNASTGEPLAGASVLVGPKRGVPFAQNIATTNSDGFAYFSDNSLQDQALPITASKAGYGNFSLLANKANTVEITLQEQPDERDFSFLQGKVHGFPPGYGSGILEVGFFLPAFRPESLFSFDPQQIVSSYKVEIDVFGKRKVPGNVVFPSQSKRYGLIPIRLDKPEFIMPLSKGLKSHMVALAGAVSISSAVGAIQKKDYLEVLNLSSLTHLAWTKRMTVRRNERFDMNVSQPISQQELSAQFSGIQQGLDLVAVSFLDPEGDDGDYVPMDIKAIKSEQIRNGQGALKMGLIQQKKYQDKFYVFAGVFDRNQIGDGKDISSRSIAGTLQVIQAGKKSTHIKSFLKPIQAVRVASSNREYSFTSATNNGVSPELMILNIVSEKKNETTQGMTRTVLWSTVFPGNTNKITLPDLGKAVLPVPDQQKAERFSWEVIALKSRESSAVQRGIDVQSSFRNLEHVSTLVKKFE